MPARRSLRAFRQDQHGFTGAERALLVCFGLAVVLLAGLLIRRGSQQAAGDAERTLASGAGALGSFAAASVLPGVGLMHAAPEAPPPEAAMRTAGLLPEAGGMPEPPPATGALTIGDTAGVRRAFTDPVYKSHLTKAAAAQVNLTDPVMKGDLALFQKNWEKNRARYEAVAQKTGVPAKLIAALHWRESSGNFNTYLHQGDPLGRPAVHWPRNIPVFHKWEDAAVHALNMKKSIRNDLGMTDKTTDLAAMATYAEYYNGLGYFNRGRTSPYVYSGTNQYTKGKYVRDGVYDPNHRDRQLGVVTMLRSISAAAPPVVTASPPAPRSPAPPTPRRPGGLPARERDQSGRRGRYFPRRSVSASARR